MLQCCTSRVAIYTTLQLVHADAAACAIFTIVVEPKSGSSGWAWQLTISPPRIFASKAGKSTALDCILFFPISPRVYLYDNMFCNIAGC